MAWFFKLTGPAKDAAAQHAIMGRLQSALRFDAQGRPDYTLPEGWTVSNGPGIRYQTITIPADDGDMEVAVSNLPFVAEAVGQYLQQNFNRWRGQLGLAPVTQPDWVQTAFVKREIVPIPARDRTGILISLQGETEEFGETSMLAIMILPITPPTSESDAESTSNRPPSSSSRSEPLTYQLPEGWEKGQGSSIRLVSLVAKSDSGDADISVIRLGGGGDALANINRWRGQVDLEPIDESALQAQTEDMQIGGKPATYVEAEGASEMIAAAIVVEGEAKWFFKIQGSVKAVQAQREQFREFLTSIEFKE